MSVGESPLVRKLVSLALEEDLAFGDITGELTVPVAEMSVARILARQELVVCGLDIVPVIIREGGFSVRWTRLFAEGVVADDMSVLGQLEGSSRDLLAMERTVLNFLQRLSGVATFTRSFCAAVETLHVLDTRKTLPGWRVLDKYATRIGGAKNHRSSLGDMIVVKNNHVDAHPKGMRGVLQDIRVNKPLYMPWEVEVRGLEELRIALEFQPSVVMLDNFSDDMVKEAVALASMSSCKPIIEVSGGVVRERLGALEALGVNAASSGALTTQATNVDISMRIIKGGNS